MKCSERKINIIDNYVAYHIHTDYSLKDSATNYKDYVDKAVELGQHAIAFSEHGNMQGWVKKKMYCDLKGIKYIHAVECYLTKIIQTKSETIIIQFLLRKTMKVLRNSTGL